MSLLIDARGLHTYYGASHILRGVDFRSRAARRLA
jgi:ABC-type branched-subunit amino acid transport system ATPase component